MNIIEEIWYGNINPNARQVVRGSRFDEASRTLCRNEEKLGALLAEREKEIFTKYQDCQREMSQISECETFIQGFRLGAQIMLEVLDKKDGCFTEILG